jgi:hypothetical protein
LKRTSKKKKNKPRISPIWERAYKGHVLWLGKLKLGKVTLQERGRYFWEGGGRAGFAEDLAKAKASVELAVAAADKQLDLFK